MFTKVLPKDELIHFYSLKENYPMPHNHNYWELLIMLGGIIIHNYNNKTEYLSKNDIVLLSPEDIHCFYEEAPHNHLHILISKKLFEKVAVASEFDIETYLKSKQKQHIYSLDNEQTANIENIVHSLQAHNFGAQLQLKLTQILFRTVLNYYLYHYAVKDSFQKTYSLAFSNIYNILTNKDNISKSVKEIRVMCGYSQSQLYRIFIKYTGQSPILYIQNIKLNYAAQLIKTTDMKIIDISTEVGFNSISNFNTKFKQCYGKTPSKYRQD